MPFYPFTALRAMEPAIQAVNAPIKEALLAETALLGEEILINKTCTDLCKVRSGQVRSG
jgi:hypothetical protein